MLSDKVKRYYEKLGYKVTSEEKLNGERADLVAEKGKERIAIEIETGNSDPVANIRKCLAAKVSMVISVPVNKAVENQIREKLKRCRLDDERRLAVVSPESLE